VATPEWRPTTPHLHKRGMFPAAVTSDPERTLDPGHSKWGTPPLHESADCGLI
jgi:hypothetical protein